MFATSIWHLAMISVVYVYSYVIFIFLVFISFLVYFMYVFFMYIIFFLIFILLPFTDIFVPVFCVILLYLSSLFISSFPLCFLAYLGI